MSEQKKWRVNRVSRSHFAKTSGQAATYRFTVEGEIHDPDFVNTFRWSLPDLDGDYDFTNAAIDADVRELFRDGENVPWVE
jgi:hypothetical protein